MLTELALAATVIFLPAEPRTMSPNSVVRDWVAHTLMTEGELPLGKDFLGPAHVGNTIGSYCGSLWDLDGWSAFVITTSLFSDHSVILMEGEEDFEVYFAHDCVETHQPLRGRYR